MARFTIRGRELNGAVLRVIGGVLIGIGLGPIVVALLVVPIHVAIGPVAAEIFRPGMQFLSLLLGLVVLHAVRLFYPGNWRTLEDR